MTTACTQIEEIFLYEVISFSKRAVQTCRKHLSTFSLMTYHAHSPAHSAQKQPRTVQCQ